MSADKLKNYRDRDGQLMSYTETGCYPVLYVTDDGCWICPACARSVDADAPADFGGLEAGEVYYEGPIVYCEDCNAEIESAYGDPDAEEEELEGRVTSVDFPVGSRVAYGDALGVVTGHSHTNEEVVFVQFDDVDPDEFDPARILVSALQLA
jgi:hypothetical protein